MAKIGKNILENLTTGMYADSKVAYREYIQNACDQIDKAVALGIVSEDEAEVLITISSLDRTINIEDNATGVEKNLFASQLGDIANSDKKLGEDKGFRGIGRLCGLAYCKKLVFTTSAKGEGVKSIMSFDAKVMRDMIAADKKYSVDEILDAIISISYEEEDVNKHYFRVDLIGINEENTDLLDNKKVRDYLSFVAPVPYSNKLIMREKIYTHAQELGFHIDEYRIRINGAQLFKEYKTYLYDANKKSYDSLFDVAFNDFCDGDGELIAWMWYGLCCFEKAIPKAQNPMYGLRLRQGNIQIGSNTVVADLFREERGNGYFVGEIFAVDRRLIPNSQRNYFNENETRVLFEDQLREYFYNTLHKLYHEANNIKNDYKHIEEYTDAVKNLEEKNQHGFVDDAERNRLFNEVADAEKKKNEALKQLEKINKKDANSMDEQSPSQKVQERIKQKYEKKKTSEDANLAKEKADKIQSNNGEKNNYFTDQFSKLSKKERQLVRRIVDIINRISPDDVAAKILSELEREFR